MPHLSEIGVVLGGVLTGGGVWSVLRTAVRGRAAVALERQRATSVTRVLDRLPPGGRLHETDDAGRYRLITVPEMTAADEEPGADPGGAPTMASPEPAAGAGGEDGAR